MSNEIENNNVNTEATVAENANVEAPQAEAVVENRSSLLDGGGATDSVKEEVSADASWLNNLDEDLKASPYVKQFADKDLNDLVKSAVNAQSLIGKKIDDFSKEEIEKFYGKMGKPEAYTLPEDLSDEQKANLSSIYSEANLSQEQANILAEKFVLENREATAKTEETHKANLADVENELKEKYGKAYEKRIELATDALTQLGGQELLDAVNEAGLGLNAKFISAMSEVGKGMIEDTIISADKETRFGITPAEAKQQIAMIMGDPDKMAAWKNVTHPKHKAVKAEIKKYLAAQEK